MPRPCLRSRRDLLLGCPAFAAALAGCHARSDPPRPESTGRTTPPTTPTTRTSSTTRTSPTTQRGSCTEYDIVTPEKPATLDETSVVEFSKALERRYEEAKLRARHENVEILQHWWRNVSVENTETGFDVTLTLEMTWSSGEDRGKGGYPTTYQITEETVVRDGTPLPCWPSQS